MLGVDSLSRRSRPFARVLQDSSNVLRIKSRILLKRLLLGSRELKMVLEGLWGNLGGLLFAGSLRLLISCSL